MFLDINNPLNTKASESLPTTTSGLLQNSPNPQSRPQCIEEATVPSLGLEALGCWVIKAEL